MKEKKKKDDCVSYCAKFVKHSTKSINFEMVKKKKQRTPFKQQKAANKFQVELLVFISLNERMNEWMNGIDK